MAFEYPDHLKYTDTHEYTQLEGDVAIVGITAFAIDQLGDIVFLEVPEVGTEVTKGKSFGTIESVKAVEDLKSPVTGTVVQSNTEMADAPENLANDPYSAGWLIKVKVSDPSEVDNGMSAEQYRGLVEGS
ncbi:glycine cleavage system protein GcvH [Myxacorys almedinensis]|uniref:Glycine cleavage system H protein n=1 Tax=Myxacorys almedinensis A TaxID=2690445 RepID=A0A8J7ZCM8_9CYAN|nr:glycine cleavage system protein GcvH [Myxacorys almedinensis]NDJ19530.1 glycine cleavage system protein GcvH [Myxacorys almedinensis A]